MVRGTYITERWIRTFKRRRGFNCDDEGEEPSEKVLLHQYIDCQGDKFIDNPIPSHILIKNSGRIGLQYDALPIPKDDGPPARTKKEVHHETEQ